VISIQAQVWASSGQVKHARRRLYPSRSALAAPTRPRYGSVEVLHASVSARKLGGGAEEGSHERLPGGETDLLPMGRAVTDMQVGPTKVTR
jgi:hypothetical protein